MVAWRVWPRWALAVAGRCMRFSVSLLSRRHHHKRQRRRPHITAAAMLLISWNVGISQQHWHNAPCTMTKRKEQVREVLRQHRPAAFLMQEWGLHEQGLPSALAEQLEGLHASYKCRQDLSYVTLYREDLLELVESHLRHIDGGGADSWRTCQDLVFQCSARCRERGMNSHQHVRVINMHVVSGGKNVQIKQNFGTGPLITTRHHTLSAQQRRTAVKQLTHWGSQPPPEGIAALHAAPLPCVIAGDFNTSAAAIATMPMVGTWSLWSPPANEGLLTDHMLFRDLGRNSVKNLVQQLSDAHTLVASIFGDPVEQIPAPPARPVPLSAAGLAGLAPSQADLEAAGRLQEEAARAAEVWTAKAQAAMNNASALEAEVERQAAALLEAMKAANAAQEADQLAATQPSFAERLEVILERMNATTEVAETALSAAVAAEVAKSRAREQRQQARADRREARLQSPRPSDMQGQMVDVPGSMGPTPDGPHAQGMVIMSAGLALADSQGAAANDASNPQSRLGSPQRLPSSPSGSRPQSRPSSSKSTRSDTVESEVDWGTQSGSSEDEQEPRPVEHPRPVEGPRPVQDPHPVEGPRPVEHSQSHSAEEVPGKKRRMDIPPHDRWADAEDDEAEEHPPANLRSISYMVLQDGSWKLDSKEETVHNIALLLALRREEVQEAWRALHNGLPPSDPPDDFILPGSYISSAHRRLREQVMPQVLRRGGHDPRATTSAKVRQAYQAWLHQTYNGKKVVDWLLRFGRMDVSSAEAMQRYKDMRTAENKSERQAYDNKTGPWALADSQRTRPAPKQSARDPAPNMSAREAAAKRRDARYLQLRARKLAHLTQTPGTCEQCHWWVQEPRVKCMRCGDIVCASYCQQPELVSCKQCYWRHGEFLATPRILPQDPNAQECHYCRTTALKGACYMCNRPLCENCSMDQMPPACWQCPSIGAEQRVHLGVPPAPRRHGSTFHQLISQDPAQLSREADQLTKQAGRGRLMTGGYVPEHRLSARGHVHTAGEWWRESTRHNSGGGSSSSHM
jgi:hypothetical protein